MISSVRPLIPYWNQGAQWTNTQWNFYKYLPEDSAKGKYLVLIGATGGYDSLYSKYCFRRAVVGWAQDVTAYTQARFSEAQLLFQLGYLKQDPDTPTGTYIVDPNWSNDVAAYAGTLLGFWMDEPSIALAQSTMDNIKNHISALNATLWLNDYDTEMVPPSNPVLQAANSYHPVNLNILQDGDFVWNDGNTSKWVSGANLFGVDVLSDDYGEFQGFFGNRFNGIVCTVMDGSGALLNDATMFYWLQDHSNCNNFALYLNPAFENAWPAALNNFEADAYDAGFLGTQNELYDYKFACQQNAVVFTPPGTSADYYGLWNGTEYTGPVAPGTQGAVVCWVLSSMTATGQFQDNY